MTQIPCSSCTAERRHICIVMVDLLDKQNLAIDVHISVLWDDVD